jgi:nucleotidyltransferase substrate binding protein (TIGR01987 family)
MCYAVRMSEDRLILTPLAKAVATLKRAIDEKRRDEFVRDAIIQRFEYTFELCWKFMVRHLRADNLLAEPLTRRDLFRAAAQARLIDDPVPWFEFHDGRNQVAHTYNEAAALKVLSIAERFLPHAEGLLRTLEKLHGGSA